MTGGGGFFERIVGAVDVGIAVYGADGAVEYVNEACADLLEADPEELVGTAIWTVDTGLERDGFGEYWDAFEAGESRTTETRFEFGGASVPVEATTARAEFDGAAHHYLTVRDVGERTARRERIEYQRSLLKAQQEATIDGFLVVNENFDIVSYNDRFAEISNLPTELLDAGDDEPVLRRVLQQVKRPEKHRERVEHLYENPEETARDQIEFEDGRVFDRYTTPVADDGTLYGRLWVFRDVTDRVERQRELERKNDRLERFAGIVSHDLRNPLNVAIGQVNLAAEECGSGHLDIAARALERMEALIDDVLVLARSGQRIDGVEPVSLGEIAARGWRTVATADAEMRVASDRAFLADRSRLVQLLENLFRNSVEHGSASNRATSDGETGARGDADVVVTVGALPDGFYVEDDGLGIPENLREDVFEVGYSTNAEGTGFGLSIVAEIAKAHGWTVAATAGEDGGARFEVTGVEPPE